MFRRLGVALVAIIAALAVSGSPARAATAATSTTTVTPPAGWIFQGSFPPGNWPFTDPCGDAAQAMMTAGTAVVWQCLRISGQMNLYTLPGPWRYHSTFPVEHSHFGGPCSDTGTALLAAGQILTWRCILRNGTDYNLEVL